MHDRMNSKYGEIINLLHHAATTRQLMPIFEFLEEHT
jgi:hypothetical protein